MRRLKGKETQSAQIKLELHSVFNQKLCFSHQVLLASKAQIHFLSIIISQANCKIATEKWAELKEPFILKAGVKRNSAYLIAVYLARTLSYDVSHSEPELSTSGCRALCVCTTYQLTAKAKLLEQNGSAFVPWTPPSQTEDNFWKLKDLGFSFWS